VINDLKKLKLRQWGQTVKDRKSFSDLVQRPTPMYGCGARKRRRRRRRRRRKKEKDNDDDDDDDNKNNNNNLSFSIYVS
jgi:hypothetical protein